MVALTESSPVLTDYIYNMLNAPAMKTSLGVKDVWYGDQTKVPQVPCLVVESGTSRRTLTGAPSRTDINFVVHVTVYHAAISDTQANRRACDTLARAVEAQLHSDKQMGGNVIHGFCTSIEPGFAFKGGALMHATRVTWEGLSKVMI